jgi:exopolysaccharide biosynthesis polyprenyl glycosylphosphotransferase
MPDERNLSRLAAPATADQLALGARSEATAASVGQLLLPELPDVEQRLVMRHRNRDRLRRQLLALADLLALSCSLALALSATSSPPLLRELLWGSLALPAWLLLFKAYGLYERDGKRISHTSLDDLPHLFHAVVVGALGLWLFFDVGPQTKVLVHSVLVFGVSALLLIVSARSLVRTGLRRLLSPERVLILGAGELSESLARKMRAHREYGLEPVGVLTTSPSDLGDLAELESVVELHRIDRIILASADAASNELLTLLSACRRLLLKVSVVPTVFEAMGPATEVDELEGVTVLGLNPPAFSQSARLIKRGIDIVGASGLLLVSLPLIVIAAIAIKLDSRGPVLFKQRRVGKGGRTFRIIKLRTMVDGAEALRDELISQSADPHWIRLDRDPRLTRVGEVLRKSSIDELPQLWNVLIGQMSLVGPRPLPEPEDQLVEGWGRGRLDLTPGITGYWQVLGRTSIPFTEMVKLDYIYVTNWSLWNDIRLIVRTLPAVLSRRGVN